MLHSDLRTIRIYARRGELAVKHAYANTSTDLLKFGLHIPSEAVGI